MSASGGCQCGAVRFRIADGGFGPASICHCRMCQKAFGAFYGPFVTVPLDKIEWTRGAPKTWKSSNVVTRGFCADCGTPLTYQRLAEEIEIAIGALDDPTAAPPTAQLSRHTRQPFVDDLPTLPARKGSTPDGMTSYQHPDHDTSEWPPHA
jgi:hypothetical protein